MSLRSRLEHETIGISRPAPQVRTRLLFWCLAFPIASLAADVGFVGFYELTLPAESARGAIVHREPDPVRHEPSATVCHAEHSVQLMRAHPLLATSHQPKCQQPFVHGDM